MQAPQALNFNNMQNNQSYAPQPFFAGSGQVISNGVPQQINFNGTVDQQVNA